MDLETNREESGEKNFSQARITRAFGTSGRLFHYTSIGNAIDQTSRLWDLAWKQNGTSRRISCMSCMD